MTVLGETPITIETNNYVFGFSLAAGFFAWDAFLILTLGRYPNVNFSGIIL